MLDLFDLFDLEESTNIGAKQIAYFKMGKRGSFAFYLDNETDRIFATASLGSNWNKFYLDTVLDMDPEKFISELVKLVGPKKDFTYFWMYAYYGGGDAAKVADFEAFEHAREVLEKNLAFKNVFLNFMYAFFRHFRITGFTKLTESTNMNKQYTFIDFINETFSQNERFQSAHQITEADNTAKNGNHLKVLFS